MGDGVADCYVNEHSIVSNVPLVIYVCPLEYSGGEREEGEGRGKRGRGEEKGRGEEREEGERRGRRGGGRERDKCLRINCKKKVNVLFSNSYL